MILLEKREGERSHTEKQCEDMASRLRDTERTLHNMQSDIQKYKVNRNISLFVGYHLYLDIAMHVP